MERFTRKDPTVWAIQLTKEMLKHAKEMLKHDSKERPKDVELNLVKQDEAHPFETQSPEYFGEAGVGDYFVEGPAGNKYFIAKDLFEKLYSPVKGAGLSGGKPLPGRAKNPSVAPSKPKDGQPHRKTWERPGGNRRR